MRASPKTGRWAGWARRWPRHASTYCCAAPPDAWDADQLTAVRARYRDVLAVLHLTRDATPDALHDLDGQAFARLGVKETAHSLIRPDGHVGYRAAGTDLDGLQRHLARWLPNPTRHPA
jgi:hypothetical protein